MLDAGCKEEGGGVRVTNTTPARNGICCCNCEGGFRVSEVPLMTRQRSLLLQLPSENGTTQNAFS